MVNPLPILSALFFLSGAAGLFYESIWARYLGLFVGHDAYGQIAVLVIFLGGMAIGSAAISGVSRRLRSPLLGYAVVELVVAALGLGFHPAYQGITRWAWETVYPGLAGSWTLPLVKWTIAGGMILPQSVLLGATFPLMTAGVIRLCRVPSGRVLGQLYFANSLGAALGVLVAGFWLVASVGLPGTLAAAAALNVAAGLGTLGVAALARRDQGTAAPDRRMEEAAAPAAPGLRRGLLAVSFGTAVASFLYEIGWIRMLSLVLGSATHSFELMLSAFILGLACGALWIRSRADRIRDPLHALGVIQWLMGGLALATLPVYAASFGWMAALLETFARTDGGYLGFTVSRYALCLAVMFPATFLAGMTLPLITRTLMVAGEGERAVGAVYAANTFGSIIGVMLGGLVLLPLIGLKATLILGAAIDMAIGVVLVRRAPAARRGLGPVLLAGAVAAVIAAGLLVNLRKGVLVSGVFRRGSPPVADSLVVFYRDGRTATVSAVQAPDLTMTWLATNGKPDASVTIEWFVPCPDVRHRVPLSRDGATQTVVSLVSLAHAPGARNVAVIGHGSGISTHHMLADTAIERLETIEIEPRMIEGARIFYPLNRRAWDDPRSVRVIDDARSWFAAGGRRYDLIMSEPSNPWVSGVSGLFTLEFYQGIRRHLTDRGVFVQWLHLYEMDDELVAGVLAALHRVFPSYEIFFTTGTDILIVAGTAERLPDPDWSVLSLPGIQQDLCRFVPLTPEAMEATRLGGRALFAPLLDSLVRPNSDFHPLLDVGAEKRRYFGGTAQGIQDLGSDRFSLAGALEHRRYGLPTDPRLGILSIARLQANSVGAQVRADSALTGVDRSEVADAGPAILKWRLWQASLQSAPRPASWPAWVRLFEETERIVSGGAQGVADTAFYQGVYRYLDRHRAPPPVRSVVDFYYGMASWDFAKVAYATDRLLPEFRRGHQWITPDELRDGAVVARLKLGDAGAARRLFRVLGPLSARPIGSFQSQLLLSHILKAEAAAGR